MIEKVVNSILSLGRRKRINLADFLKEINFKQKPPKQIPINYDFSVLVRGNHSKTFGFSIVSIYDLKNNLYENSVADVKGENPWGEVAETLSETILKHKHGDKYISHTCKFTYEPDAKKRVRLNISGTVMVKGSYLPNS